MTHLDPSIEAYGLSSLICALFALVFMYIGKRSEHDRHYFLLSAGCGGIGLRFAIAKLGPADLAAFTPGFLPLYLLGTGSLLLLWLGLQQHLGVPAHRRRQLQVWWTFPQLLIVFGVSIAVLAGAQVPRAPFVALTYSTVLLLAYLGIRAQRQEPGVGHGVVATILLLFPFGLAGVMAAGHPVGAVIAAVITPTLVLMMAVLPTAFLRERLRLKAALGGLEQRDRALSQANERLEQRVMERTAELQAALASAESAASTKDHVLSSVMQDVQPPLQKLDGLLDVLSRSMLSPAHLELVGSAREAATDLAELVNRGIDQAARSGAQAQPTERSAFDPYLQVVRCLAEFRSQAQQQGIELVLQTEGRIQPLWGDGRRINQVLRALVSNAIRYTSTHQVQVRLHDEPASDHPGHRILSLSVQHSADEVDGLRDGPRPGEGLADDGQPRPQVRERRLRACQRLCQLMGGDLSTQSWPDGQSTVSFWVPCDLLVSPDKAPSSDPAEVASEPAQAVLC